MYTNAQLEQIYLTSAKSKVQDIDITNLSDFQAKGFATGGVGGTLSQDCTRMFNEAIPQYASSLGINTRLSAQGLSPQYPATPSVVSLSANSLVDGYTYIIPIGTILTASSGQTYKVLASSYGQTQVVLTSAANIFYAVSVNTGITTIANSGDILTMTPPIVSTDTTQTFNSATVIACQNGTNQESLSSATARLINVMQTPLCGTRSTDFQKMVINPLNGITNAIALTNGQLLYSNTLYTVGVFLVASSPITDDILNQGLVTGTTTQVFNRSASEGVISSTQQYLVAQEIIGARPNTRTVQTQGLTSNPITNPYFKIEVTLQNGYTLDSQITLNGNVFTLRQLIQRETRRAVCQQPFGATLSQDITTGAYISSIFLISAIEQQLDSSLGSSSTTGTLGAYLVDRTIMVLVDGINYTQPSNIPLNLGIPTVPTDNLLWIYDIATDPTLIYPNILVALS